MVLVGGVGLCGQQDGVLCDEPRDVIYVTMRVVAGAAAVEPKYLIDAEVFGEDLLQLFARHTRVPLLHLTEQALFCCQYGTRAIHVNRTTLQHHAAAFAIGFDERLKGTHVSQQRNVLGDAVVALPVWVFGPRVELPIGQRSLAIWFFDKDRSRVSQPDAVSCPVVKVQPRQVRAGSQQDAPRPPLRGGIIDQDIDFLHLRQMANNFRIDPGYWLKLAGPVLRVVGPGDPGGKMRLPLGRHAIAKAARRLRRLRHTARNLLVMPS